MPTREFVDSAGVAWRVWGTLPSDMSVRVTKFAAGWLTFESEGSLRRLTPLPQQWETASNERLELMCRTAVEVTRRTGQRPQVRLDASLDDEAGDAPDG